MKRAALHESIRRGIALHMGKRAGLSGAALLLMAADGMKTPNAFRLADEILLAIEAEYPGAITP